ncbi:bifunctional aspartokinase/homoserine dehydrogenase I (AKI-HDI) [Escherichia coli]|nr:bifunctional aspartokinase/homoserine dehydrogenase I (AKI-HDI) [Escherichia coli]
MIRCSKVKNGENALAFYSHYYQPLPLVLRGYGAGNDVTAAGVFADLLRTLMEVRSLTWLKFMPRLPVPI